MKLTDSSPKAWSKHISMSNYHRLINFDVDEH